MPAGYRMVSENALTVVFKEEYEQSFAGFAVATIPKPEDDRQVPSGRENLVPFPLAESPTERALIRRCIRGGILGKFLKDRYFGRGTPRPLAELRVSEYARDCGIPTPQILAVAVERQSFCSYAAALAIREIASSADLEAEWGKLEQRSDKQISQKKEWAVSAVGKLVARMHDAGIYHADLHLKNILLSRETDEPKLYLLDLDAARIRQPLSELSRCMNLLRLYRSVEKLNRCRKLVSRSDLLRFLDAYAAESSKSAAEIRERLRRMLPIWRLKWRLSDLLGV